MKTRFNWMLWLVMLSIAAALTACNEKNKDNEVDQNSDGALIKTKWSQKLDAAQLKILASNTDLPIPEGMTAELVLEFETLTKSEIDMNVNIPLGNMPMTGKVEADVPYVYSGQSKKVILKLSQASDFQMTPAIPGVNVNEFIMKEDIHGIVNWEKDLMVLTNEDGDTILSLKRVK